MVKITKGKYKGMIGYYDDHDFEKGYIYYGSPLHNSNCYLVPIKYLSNQVTTSDLVKRGRQISQELMKLSYSTENIENIKKHMNLLSEDLFITNELSSRYLSARRGKEGKKIFISHSSLDKPFARLLATDLIENGFDAWLDEWKIDFGALIPEEVQKGIDDCDYFLIVLSNNSNQSVWVKEEYYSIMPDILLKDKKVIPVKIDDSDIPRFFKSRKYLDLSKDYNNGLIELLVFLNKK